MADDGMIRIRFHVTLCHGSEPKNVDYFDLEMHPENLIRTSREDSSL